MSTTTRTIRADQLGDAQMGRLVSLAGHPPRRLARPIVLRTVVVLVWGTTTTAVTRDTEITIHPES